MRRVQRARAVVVAAVLAAAAAGGCSDVRKLAQSLATIQTEAAGVEEDCREATDAYEQGEDPRPFVSNAAERAGRIRRAATTGQEALGGVEDTTPWWARTAMWLAAAAVLAITAYLVGGPIRNLLARLVPPRAVRTSATMDRKLLEGQVSAPEAVAARRASDPSYETAYQRAAKQTARKG